MAKRLKIKENKKPNKEIKENKKPLVDEEGIIVDFSQKTAFYSCKIGRYTNFLKEHDDFIEFRKELFGEALQYFKGKTFSELGYKGSHTHVIDDKEKLNLIEKILKELVLTCNPDLKKELIDKIVDNYMQEIWQLGYKQGLRLIGVRTKNIFTVLFIDYHHLIYPSIKHNTNDVLKYDYCAMRN